MTISKRIYFTSGFLWFVIGAISFFAVSRLMNLNHVTRRIVEDSLPGVIIAGKISDGLAGDFIRVNRLLLAETSEERWMLKEEMAGTSETISASFKEYEVTIFADDDREKFKVLGEKREAYRKAREEFLTLVDTNRTEARKVLESKVLPAYTAYDGAAHVLGNFNKQNGELRGIELAKEVKTNV